MVRRHLITNQPILYHMGDNKAPDINAVQLRAAIKRAEYVYVTTNTIDSATSVFIRKALLVREGKGSASPIVQYVGNNVIEFLPATNPNHSMWPDFIQACKHIVALCQRDIVHYEEQITLRNQLIEKYK